jgi:hypothetical protein
MELLKLNKQIADGMPCSFRKHADYLAKWHLTSQRSQELSYIKPPMEPNIPTCGMSRDNGKLCPKMQLPEGEKKRFTLFLEEWNHEKGFSS